MDELLKIRVPSWLARLYLISPFILIYYFHFDQNNRPGGFWTWVFWIGVYYCCLCAWDSKRITPRCPISEILMRGTLFFLVVYATVVGWFFWGTMGWTDGFLYMFLVSHFTVYSLVIPQLIIHSIMSDTIYPSLEEKFERMVQSGYSPFWDELHPIFNPTSYFVKQGGFEEPTYTGFVPPSHWRYQCPNCGVKLERNPTICWNCNYGADGNSDAYYKRWGHIDPPPPGYKFQNEQQEYDQEDPQQGQYGPM
jgi:hypothetical protein